MTADSQLPAETANSPQNGLADQGDIAPVVGPNPMHLALVAVLVCALLMGPIALLWQIDPAGPWRPMPLFALLVAIESVLTRRWLDWPTRRRQKQAYSLA